MTIDISRLPIIDDHCHPFMPTREKKSFDNCFTLSLIPPRAVTPETLCYSKLSVKR